MRHLPFVDPNRRPALPVVTTVTVDRSTRFGFHASARRLELIISAEEADEDGSGSSLHLVIEDAPEIVTAVIALLSTGRQEVERIGESNGVTRWPRPRPRPRPSPRSSPYRQPSERTGIWLTGA